MQYKRVEQQSSDEEVGPKLTENETKAKEFYDQTVGLIEKEKNEY